MGNLILGKIIMPNPAREVEVVTFKIDKSLKQLMKGIENRSQFIRTAILNALENVCPFCKGTGVLTPHRKKHFNDLAKKHGMQMCDGCDEVVVGYKK